MPPIIAGFLFFLFFLVRIYFTRYKYPRKVKEERKFNFAFLIFAVWALVIILIILPVEFSFINIFNIILDNITKFGEFLMLISILFLYLGHYSIGKQWPVSKDMKNYKLIDYGIYRYVRHPIYSSFFLFAVGSTIAFSNLLLLIIIIPLTVLYKHLMEEEKNLADRFGKKYVDYSRRTKRFIPWLI